MNDFTLVIGNKNYSSWSLRAWLYLAINKIPFDEIQLPLDTPEFYQRVGEYSPTHCVPALKDGEVKVWDSLAIIEYVRQTKAPVIGWPEDPALKAIALSAVMEMHTGFMALRSHYPMNCRKPPFVAQLRGDIQKDLTRLDQLWRSCLEVSRGPALFGELTIADVYFAPVVFRLNTYQLPVSKPCKDYMAWMLELPEMKRWAEAAAAEAEIVDVDEWKD
ncbi:MAG: glutathione S-transferase family protein [Cellvibrionaceae bacterium]